MFTIYANYTRLKYLLFRPNIEHFIVDEMNPLEQRWYKMKQYTTFPIDIKYYGDCGLPLEYVEYLPEQLRNQAMEVLR